MAYKGLDYNRISQILRDAESVIEGRRKKKDELLSRQLDIEEQRVANEYDMPIQQERMRIEADQKKDYEARYRDSSRQNDAFEVSRGRMDPNLYNMKWGGGAAVGGGGLRQSGGSGGDGYQEKPVDEKALVNAARDYAEMDDDLKKDLPMEDYFSNIFGPDFRTRGRQVKDDTNHNLDAQRYYDDNNAYRQLKDRTAQAEWGNNLQYSIDADGSARFSDSGSLGEGAGTGFDNWKQINSADNRKQAFDAQQSGKEYSTEYGPRKSLSTSLNDMTGGSIPSSGMDYTAQARKVAPERPDAVVENIDSGTKPTQRSTSFALPDILNGGSAESGLMNFGATDKQQPVIKPDNQKIKTDRFQFYNKTPKIKMPEVQVYNRIQNDYPRAETQADRIRKMQIYNPPAPRQAVQPDIRMVEVPSKNPIDTRSFNDTAHPGIRLETLSDLKNRQTKYDPIADIQIETDALRKKRKKMMRMPGFPKIQNYGQPLY